MSRIYGKIDNFINLQGYQVALILKNPPANAGDARDVVGSLG